ncbi:MAG TPA: hypothetical protein VMJ35_09760 [Dongiaceae bacterium]|nr:hypothetical protein [Dongiaceae bacterium]
MAFVIPGRQVTKSCVSHLSRRHSNFYKLDDLDAEYTGTYQ